MNFWIFNYNQPNAFKKAWFIFIAVTLGSILLSVGIKDLKFDYDFEKFFPENDQESIFFREHRKKFESDNDFLLVAIERKKGVFNNNFLYQVADLSKAIEQKVPYVTLVASITNVKNEKILPFGGRISDPFIHLNGDLKKDSIHVFESKELVNSLIAKDAKSVCIYIRHEDYILKEKSDVMLAQLQKLIDGYHFEAVHIAGRTIGQKLYVEKMVHEMFFFLALSGLMVVLFLIFTFRSIWGVVIPSIVIALSTASLLGAMGWLGIPVNILLITLPTILFIVAMSDVIHVVSRYLDALRAGMTKVESISITIKEVGFSAFLTSVTTAIGFATLYFVQMEPIQVFGLVTGLGVVIAFVITMVLLPAMFFLFPSPKIINQSNEKGFWQKYLRSWYIKILRKRSRIIVIYGVLTFVCFGALFYIRNNNYLMDDLRDNDPIKKDCNYLDAHYGGIRPFELAVTIKDQNLNIWDPTVLTELDRIENYIESTYGAEIKTSLVGAVKVLHRSSNFGDNSFYRIPETNHEVRQIRKVLRIAKGGKLIRTILDSSERVTRMHGNFPDLGSIVIEKRNEALYKFLENSPLNDKVEFRVTGTAHLFDKNIRFLTGNLVEGLAIEIALLALLMGIVYRSLSMIIIFMIPNLIPLFIIGAIMSFFQIELKTSTAIIFTIALGIAVDDTIHLLGKFRYELGKGKSKLYALKTAYLTTAKATIITTLVLCAGFMLLIFSSFVGAFNMGLLISITLFIAMIIDITLLPVLLTMFFKSKNK